MRLMNKEKSKNIIYVLTLIMAAALTGYTLWDVCKTDGAGIYLSMMWNAEYGPFFDVLIWTMMMTILIVLLLMPLAYIKSYKVKDFFFAESFIMAFMPVISVGNMMHIADGSNLDMISFEDNVLNYVMEGLAKYLTSAALIITLMVILVLFGFKKITKEDMDIIKSKSVSILLLSVLLGVVGILIPGMTDLSAVLIDYILVFALIIIYDKVINESGNPHKFIWLNLLCYLAGAYRMVDVLINTHIVNY